MFGGIERSDNDFKFFVEIVPDRKEDTLLDVINRHIKPNTIIMSDEWRSYWNLDEQGFLHETVNHSQNFVDPNNPLVHTQTIESRWSCIKRFLKRKGTNLKTHIEEYLLEYIYRKKFGSNLFEQMIIDINNKYQLN